MSTTTTLSLDADNWLYETGPTSKYGGGALVQIGIGGDIKRRNGIFEVDVSAFTAPSDITSAILTLTATTGVGVTENDMILQRLTQSFDETQSNWNTYDGTNGWTTAGAYDDVVAGETTYTVQVGNTENIVVDIVELVRDAINQRSGILRFIIYFEGTPSSSGYTKFASRSNGTTENRPTLAVTVAERNVWTGAIDGDLGDSRNWSGAAIPTSNDIAIFSNSADVTRGSLTCNKVYIGKNYTGAIGSTSTLIPVQANEVHLANKTNTHISLNGSVSTLAEVRIMDTVASDGEFRLAGKYNATVRRSRHRISLDTTETLRVDAHTNRATIQCSDDATNIRLTGANATLDNGGQFVKVSNRARVSVSRVDFDSTNITISSGGIVTCLGDEIEQIDIHNGSAIFRGNEGAPIVVSGLTIYPKGVANTKTGSATFTMGSPVNVYGGRLLLDGSQSVSVS